MIENAIAGFNDPPIDHTGPTNCFVLKSPIPDWVFCEDLRRYDRLQCSSALSARDCVDLNAYLAAHPQTRFRAYQGHDAPALFDLEFLSHLPALRELWLEANAGALNDLSPLAMLPEGLEILLLDTVAQYSDKTQDTPKTGIEVLLRLQKLKSLTLCGRLKDIGFLQSLPALQELRIWRSKLKNLNGIESQPHLHELQLWASGVKDLAPLASLQNLQSLEIDMQRNMADLTPLTQMRNLRQLQVLRSSVIAPLPSFANFHQLRVVLLEKLLSVESLARVAEAPALQCLILPGSTNLLGVEALRALNGHPTLREIRIESFDPVLWKRIEDAYGWKVDFCHYDAKQYLR